MIGKIVKGTSFSGCVNYVLKEDKSRLLKAVGVYGSPEEIAEQFELQTLLNDKVKNTVGHISLSFSAEDGDRIRDDDGLMLKIAHDYMKLMGIENTQFIIVRHTDRDHPHCHIVYNRVDNDGRTISDKNDRYRNEKVCKMLTARYHLHFAEGKEHVNFMRLRHHGKLPVKCVLQNRKLVPTRYDSFRFASESGLIASNYIKSEQISPSSVEEVLSYPFYPFHNTVFSSVRPPPILLGQLRQTCRFR